MAVIPSEFPVTSTTTRSPTEGMLLVVSPVARYRVAGVSQMETDWPSFAWTTSWSAPDPVTVPSTWEVPSWAETGAAMNATRMRTNKLLRGAMLVSFFTMMPS